MFLHCLELISIILTGMIAGTLFGLRWATANFTQKQLMQSLQLMLPPLQKWFPPLAFAALITTAALTALSLSNHIAFVLYLVAALSIVAVIVITVRGNVPINAELAKWDPESPPPEWAAQIKHWENYNSQRTLISVTGFIILLATVIFSNS